MALVVVAVVIGAVAGRALRPLRYRHLGRPRLRWLPVLAAGVLASVAADRLDGSTAVAVAIAGQAALVAGAAANLHLVGAGILAIGLALNLVSMAVDGGVPVRRGAVVAAGLLEPAELEGATVDGPRHFERDDDRLPALGDALPIEALGTVVSFGDLIVVVGIADTVAHAARRRRRARAHQRDTVVIDLRDHLLSDDEVAARLRHPTALPV